MDLLKFFKKPKYFKLPDKRVVFWDIDNTLVRWKFTEEEKEKYGIHLGWSIWMVPHRKHIQLLKQFHTTGLINVLWSAGGSNWAAMAAKLLGIESFIDAVISKPTWYADDLTPDEFMPEANRIYKEDFPVDR